MSPEIKWHGLKLESVCLPERLKSGTGYIGPARSTQDGRFPVTSHQVYKGSIWLLIQQFHNQIESSNLSCHILVSGCLLERRNHPPQPLDLPHASRMHGSHVVTARLPRVTPNLQLLRIRHVLWLPGWRLRCLLRGRQRTRQRHSAPPLLLHPHASVHTLAP